MEIGVQSARYPIRTAPLAKAAHPHFKPKHKPAPERWETPYTYGFDDRFTMRPRNEAERQQNIKRKCFLVRKTEEIYEILTQKEMRRAWPTDSKRLKETIADSLLHGYTLDLVGLWGGFKESPTGLADEYDAIALDRLSSIKKEVQASLDAIPKWVTGEDRSITCKIYLVFCDMHHRIASGVSAKECNKYLVSLSTLAEERGVTIFDLSDFYQRGYSAESVQRGEPWYKAWLGWNLTQPSLYEFDRMFKTDAIKRGAVELCGNDEFMSHLRPMAEKRHTPFCRELSTDDLARAYIETELVFLKLIKNDTLFSRSIFFSYSNPKVQGSLFDTYNLPHLFFCATKRNLSDCPWFMYPGKKRVDESGAGVDSASEKIRRESERIGATKPKKTFSVLMLRSYIRKCVLTTIVGAAMVAGVGHVLPYPALFATWIGEGLVDGQRTYTNLRVKYHASRKSPSFQEFMDHGISTPHYMREFCRNVAFADYPEWLFGYWENRERFVTIKDVTDRVAKKHYLKANKLLAQVILWDARNRFLDYQQRDMLLEAIKQYEQSLKQQKSIAAYYGLYKAWEELVLSGSGALGRTLTDDDMTYLAAANELFLAGRNNRNQ